MEKLLRENGGQLLVKALPLFLSCAEAATVRVSLILGFP
jgi:hypothetical protein